MFLTIDTYWVDLQHFRKCNFILWYSCGFLWDNLKHFFDVNFVLWLKGVFLSYNTWQSLNLGSWFMPLLTAIKLFRIGFYFFKLFIWLLFSGTCLYNFLIHACTIFTCSRITAYALWPLQSWLSVGCGASPCFFAEKPMLSIHMFSTAKLPGAGQGTKAHYVL